MARAFAAEQPGGATRPGRLPEPVLQSFGERVTPVDPVALFAYAQRMMGGACYWQRPDERLTLVGLGAAQQIAIQGPAGRQWVFLEARREWQRLVAGAQVAGDAAAPPLFLGGFAFDAQKPASGAWSGFPAGLLILPRLLYRQVGEEAWITYSVVLSPGAPAERAFRTLRDSWLAARGGVRDWGTQGDTDMRNPDVQGNDGTTVSSSPHPRIPQSPHLPYDRAVADAAAAARAGKMEKVVLARQLALPAEDVVDADTALARLRERAAGGAIFAFAGGGRCFLGATPERLARLRAGLVTTAALAGSRPRGATAAEDALQEDALLRSRKDRWEHAIVVRELIEGLGEAGVELEATPRTTVHKLGTVQHLHTPLVGSVDDGCTMLDLLARLHPTPAVGGYPRAAAMDWIRDREGIDRGWYAGPVGWLDVRGDGDFAVAIRSALLDQHGATLFAGCGIVGDSDPEAEYAESELKLLPMLAALRRR